MKEMIKGRQKYPVIIISLLGIVLTGASIYYKNSDLMFLGMSPLMASMPLIVGWGLFMEWVNEDIEGEDK